MSINRDMVFVSHANPNDNEFAQWLALQLAREGYPVWCDLTKLLGGEDFWRDIEVAIRQRSIKFLYVLSKTSNDINRTGTMQEVSVAKAVAKQIDNFIVPLKIDDLSFDDVNIELKRFNAVDFSRSWADGFNRLRKVLVEANVPTRQNFSPDAVTNWWREHFSADEGVVKESEQCGSNWFGIYDPPPVWSHMFEGDWETAKKEIAGPYPFVPHGQCAISLAPAGDLQAEFSKCGLNIVRSSRWKFEDFKSPANCVVPLKEARNALQFLLRTAWEEEMARRGLHVYGLANGKRCYFYTKGQIPRDVGYYVGPTGKTADRQLVGKSKELNWHYAGEVRALLYPIVGYALRAHVVFSRDGITPEESASAQHRARRSRCKLWWNDKWRDLSLAFMGALTEAEFRTVRVSTGSTDSFRVSGSSEIFSCPVKYTVTERVPVDDLPEDEDEDEDEGDVNADPR